MSFADTGLVIPSSDMNLKMKPSIGESNPSFWKSECVRLGFNKVMMNLANESLVDPLLR